jgi:hypothetical protein
VILSGQMRGQDGCIQYRDVAQVTPKKESIFCGSLSILPTDCGSAGQKIANIIFFLNTSLLELFLLLLYTGTGFAGYPAGRISSQSKSRIQDIRPDFQLSMHMYNKILNQDR